MSLHNKMISSSPSIRILLLATTLCGDSARGDMPSVASEGRWLRPRPTSQVQMPADEAAAYGRHVLELRQQLSAERLKELGQENVEAFANARPFPHISFDNLFPDDFLRKFAAEFPEVA